VREGRELPVGWGKSALGDLVEFVYGKSLPARTRVDGDVPVYGSNGVVGNHKEALASEPCIIIGRKGSVGEVHFSEVPAWPIDTTYYISEPGPFNLRFLFFLLKGLGLNELNKATAIPGLNRQDAYQLNVDLPPEAEQRRIAAKLETTLAAVEACRQRLDGVAAILKRFRQAVLAAATSGELTREWREERGEPEWTTEAMGECGAVTGGITKNSSRSGLFLQKQFLRVANVYHNRLALDDLAVIGVTEAEYTKTVLQPGDLLIVEGNGSLQQVGRVAIWVDHNLDCIHQNHLIRWRSLGMMPKWALYWLMSPIGRDLLEKRAKSTTGLHTLSVSKISGLPIPAPGISEQEKIIDRVDSLFTLAGQLEARLTAARKIVDRLTPALLAKAFRGELVPQDPGDEPASALLARIRAARQAEAAASGPSRRGRKKAATTLDPIALDAAPVQPDLLRELLQECGALSERALLAASELDPDRFRQQLALERSSGAIRVTGVDGQEVLEAQQPQ